MVSDESAPAKTTPPASRASTAVVRRRSGSSSSVPAAQTPRQRLKTQLNEKQMYRFALEIVRQRALGRKYSEIAEELRLDTAHLNQILAIGHAKGWLNMKSFSDIDDQIEVVLAGKVVRNLGQLLDARDDDGQPRHKDVALELFKHRQASKAGQPSAAVGIALRIDVVAPPAHVQQTIRPGSMTVVDAEVSE